MRRIEAKGKGSIGRRLLRLMKPGSGLQASVTLKEEKTRDDTPRRIFHGYEEAYKVALIRAEQGKAQGLVAWERRRFPY